MSILKKTAKVKNCEEKKNKKVSNFFFCFGLFLLELQLSLFYALLWNIWLCNQKYCTVYLFIYFIIFIFIAISLPFVFARRGKYVICIFYYIEFVVKVEGNKKMMREKTPKWDFIFCEYYAFCNPLLHFCEYIIYGDVANGTAQIYFHVSASVLGIMSLSTRRNLS